MQARKGSVGFEAGQELLRLGRSGLLIGWFSLLRFKAIERLTASLVRHLNPDSQGQFHNTLGNQCQKKHMLKETIR